MAAPNANLKGQFRPSPDCPFTLSELLDEPTPPQLFDAPVGHTVPTGRQCAGCGTLNQFWVMNPFVARSKKHGGWVLYEPATCHCPGKEDDRVDWWLTKSKPPAYDQAWLNTEFSQRPRLSQTFLTYNRDANRMVRPVWQEAEAFARRINGQLPDKGLLLVGPSGIGKGHLLAAVAQVARLSGHLAVTISAPQLLELTQPDRADFEEERRAKLARWNALQRLPLLCIKDVLLQPLAPSEVATLDRLLEARQDKGNLTCFSAPSTPFALKSRFGAARPETAALCRRLGVLARTVQAPPGTPAYTHPTEVAR